jgi:hypothetical protein
MLIYENIPCWYELSFRKSALILRIHKEFIEKQRVDLSKSPIVEHYKKELKLPDFEDDFSKNIGFGGVFKYLREIDNFVEFEITTPKIKEITASPCVGCNGTGLREDYYDSKCAFCDGTGYKWSMQWEEIVKISATFSILTTWLKYPDIETTSPLPQLLILDTITQEGLNGGSLGGDIGIPFKLYLESLGERVELPRATIAMKNAHNHMFGNPDLYQDWDFGAYVRSGKFIINCPGNACGLHPSEWHGDENEGFEFTCHNVDSPAQQLVLIIGLAVLCGMARKNMNGDN